MYKSVHVSIQIVLLYHFSRERDLFLLNYSEESLVYELIIGTIKIDLIKIDSFLQCIRVGIGIVIPGT